MYNERDTSRMNSALSLKETHKKLDSTLWNIISHRKALFWLIGFCSSTIVGTRSYPIWNFGISERVRHAKLDNATL